MFFKQHSFIALAILLGTGAGCNFSSNSTSTDNSPSPPPNTGVLNVSGCVAGSSGSTWVPNVATASAANHNSNITVNTSQISTSAPLSGLADPINGREVTVTFTVPGDLGLNGSVTLLGQVSNYPSGITATSFPVLTSLSDGTNEYINLPRDGSGNVNCAGGSFYTCAGSNCSANTSCQTVGYPSAYADFTHYWQHQLPNWGYETVNRFPTCRWTQGNTLSLSPSTPACAFNTYLAGSSGHLPVGNYTAKYFLLTDGYATIPANFNATLQVSVVQKHDTVDNVVGGAVDVNVILVGSKNITDSHTVAGQRNLNTLFNSYGAYLNTANAAVKLGTINVYELTCAQGGDQLATISSSQVGTLLQVGSSALPAATQGKAINVFLMSEFSDSSSILGIDGSITAPPINGLQTSGLTVATFNMMALFNPACVTTPCPANTQDADFYELGNTIAHETGHFLGLNHPSEAAGTTHDIVFDTPMCTATDAAANNQISINSCLNHDINVFPATGKTCNQACPVYNSATGTYCPAATECGYNHMMWYQSKNYFPASGAADGNQFSVDSGAIMNYSSYVQ
jgi:hypothetical protein